MAYLDKPAWYETFRYDLRDLRSPFVVFIDNLTGKRSELKPYSYVVLPARCRFIAKTRGGG